MKTTTKNKMITDIKGIFNKNIAFSNIKDMDTLSDFEDGGLDGVSKCLQFLIQIEELCNLTDTDMMDNIYPRIDVELCSNYSSDIVIRPLSDNILSIYVGEYTGLDLGLGLKGIIKGLKYKKAFLAGRIFYGDVEIEEPTCIELLKNAKEGHNV